MSNGMVIKPLKKFYWNFIGGIVRNFLTLSKIEILAIYPEVTFWIAHNMLHQE